MERTRGRLLLEVQTYGRWPFTDVPIPYLNVKTSDTWLAFDFFSKFSKCQQYQTLLHESYHAGTKTINEPPAYTYTWTMLQNIACCLCCCDLKGETGPPPQGGLAPLFPGVNTPKGCCPELPPLLINPDSPVIAASVAANTSGGPAGAGAAGSNLAWTMFLNTLRTRFAQIGVSVN